MVYRPAAPAASVRRRLASAHRRPSDCYLPPMTPTTARIMTIAWSVLPLYSYFYVVQVSLIESEQPRERTDAPWNVEGNMEEDNRSSRESF